MIATSDMYEKAKSAYLALDFERAKLVLDEIIDLAPNSGEGVAARLLRARGYEDGHFDGGIDLDLAYADYFFLSNGLKASSGMLGCARVLYEKGSESNKEKIIELCRSAIELDANVKAMMLMGLAYEQLFKNENEARHWYLMAFRSGLPWGLKFFARSHKRSKNFVRAAIAYMLAFLVTPLLDLRRGARSPFH